MSKKSQETPARSDEEHAAEPVPPDRERRGRQPAHEPGGDDADTGTVRSVTQSEFGAVQFDPNGNARWQWRVETPRRRQEDDTIDLLECLDPDLSLSEEDEPADPAGGFDPYDKNKLR